MTEDLLREPLRLPSPPLLVTGPPPPLFPDELLLPSFWADCASILFPSFATVSWIGTSVTVKSVVVAVSTLCAEKSDVSVVVGVVSVVVNVVVVSCLFAWDCDTVTGSGSVWQVFPYQKYPLRVQSGLVTQYSIPSAQVGSGTA
jgi:hypothetical protein